MALDIVFVVWFLGLTIASCVMEYALSRCRERSFRVITCGQLQAFICANTMLGGIMRVSAFGLDSYDVKYLEWTVAAPLIVLQTCVIASVDVPKTRNAVLQTFVYCICGIVASKTDILWLKASVVLGGTILCMLVVARLVSDGVRKPGVPAVATVQVAIALFTWPVYVGVWLVGPHCMCFMSEATEHIVELVLGMVMKTANMHVLIVDSERTVIFDLDEAVKKET